MLSDAQPCWTGLLPAHSNSDSMSTSLSKRTPMHASRGKLHTGDLDAGPLAQAAREKLDNTTPDLGCLGCRPWGPNTRPSEIRRTLGSHGGEPEDDSDLRLRSGEAWVVASRRNGAVQDLHNQHSSQNEAGTTNHCKPSFGPNRVRPTLGFTSLLAPCRAVAQGARSTQKQHGRQTARRRAGCAFGAQIEANRNMKRMITPGETGLAVHRGWPSGECTLHYTQQSHKRPAGSAHPALLPSNHLRCFPPSRGPTNTPPLPCASPEAASAGDGQCATLCQSIHRMWG